MNELMKLSRDAQIILGGTLVYVILSFLPWQQYCASGGGITVCAGRSEWHGIGVLGGLIALALLLWEASRMLSMKIELGGLPPALISVVLALALLVFTVITFLSHSAYRHWPEWLALIVSIVVAVVATRRGRCEGVEIPKVAAAMATAAGSSATTSTSSPEPSAAAGDEGDEPPPDA
jgi:hypothetical protein